MRKVDYLQCALLAGLIGLVIPLKGFASPHKEIDLRTMSEALGSVATKLDQGGAGALIGAPQLPDYKPGRRGK